MEKNREIWLDWLRVTACFLVMLTHSTEPFYLGGEGSLILTHSDAVWTSIMDVLSRAAVALFVIASSYLQLPLRYSTGEFFRKRASRILPPFLIWTIVYAFAFGEPVQNFRDLLWNFNYAAGHLWFVYMLVGLYLAMPLISPWAERVGKRELQVYLGIWLFTTMIPLIRDWLGGAAPVIYGPSGIPNPAKYPLWGEASWNTYGLFYYVSGMLGYALMGLYFKKFVGEMTWKKTLAIAFPVFSAGFAISVFGFLRRVGADSGGVFPVEGPVGLAAIWETTWLNDSIGVALMAIGWILILRKINFDNRFYRKVVQPVSKASYGMYLSHMLVLGLISAWLRDALRLGGEGVLGLWTTPVQIVATALISYVIVATACVLIRKIPRLGKVIVG
ncbi:MAG: acyltransferase [Bacteroidales bacterium]|nr:acyltransferase [Bacteroidales bacterium]